MNVRKTIYLNCIERYEDMSEHRMYAHNLTVKFSCLSCVSTCNDQSYLLTFLRSPVIFICMSLLCCRVREASMTGLETLSRFVVESDPSLLTPEM